MSEVWVQTEDAFRLEGLGCLYLLVDAVAVVGRLGLYHHLAVEQEVQVCTEFAFSYNRLSLTCFSEVKACLPCSLLQVVAAHSQEEGQSQQAVVYAVFGHNACEGEILNSLRIIIPISSP